MTAGEGPGDVEPELLTSSADEPTAEERVRRAVAGSGARGWLSRHRLLLAGSVGVLVLVAGVITYVSTRPPPVDPVIHVSVVGFMGGGGGDLDAEGRPRRSATYQLTADVGGDVNSVVGVVGPGLTAASTTIGDVLYGRPQVGDLGAAIDCTDDGWWDAKDADYQVGISRTDQYGRVTVGGVPLGDTPVGPSDTFWHDDVVRTCVSGYFRTLPPPSTTTVSAGDGSQVDITLSFTNPGDHAIQVKVTDFAAEATVLPGPWTTISAGGQATVTVSAVSAGCDGGPARVTHVMADDGTGLPDRGLPLYLAVDGDPADERQGYGWVVLTPAFADAVDAELAKLCA